METVFDHSITKQEKEDMGIRVGVDEYKKHRSQESAFIDIAFLYGDRGDIVKAKYYANKLPERAKLDTLRTINHP